MQSFEVIYSPSSNPACGSNKSKGFLVVNAHGKEPFMWLKTEDRTNLRKGPMSAEVIESIKVGLTLNLAGLSIEIVSSVDSNKSKENKESSSNKRQLPLSTDPIITDSKLSFNSSTPCVDSSSHAPKRRRAPVVDPALLALLKPHQVQAVAFLINRLTTPSASLMPDDPPTGAILADDVGTGKTLVGLVVLHTLSRSIGCKSLVVCPSSLVLNWKREISKWFPSTLAYTALVVEGSKSDSIVYSFIHSSLESRPLLVMSYDHYRSFSVALNSCKSLRVVLCDEGHRIKNAEGTKTTLALDGCAASMRVALTGTPIQNNLEELFAVVNFVCPQYLGTRQHFRSRYCTVGGEHTAELKQKLGRIMLRRSGDDVLRGLLPPRTEMTMKCVLSDAEKARYIGAVDRDAEEAGGSDTLALLTRLRLLCSVCREKDGNDDDDGDKGDGLRYAEGSKLRLVECMVAALMGESEGKLVLVSSFTIVLDVLSRMLTSMRCSCFRIDGAVALERRDRIVSAFNCAGNPIRVLLLSARAGGVGLTLTGANRMVLMEPDWNPAVDAQCMGRVWRQGQTKPVFVYRLSVQGSIEESIVRRQRDKTQVADAMMITDECSGSTVDCSGVRVEDVRRIALPRGRDMEDLDDYCEPMSLPCEDAVMRKAVADFLASGSKLRIEEEGGDNNNVSSVEAERTAG